MNDKQIPSNLSDIIISPNDENKCMIVFLNFTIQHKSETKCSTFNQINQTLTSTYVFKYMLEITVQMIFLKAPVKSGRFCVFLSPSRGILASVDPRQSDDP